MCVCASEHKCYDTRKSNFFLRINFVEIRERNVSKFGIKIERTLSIFAELVLFIDRQIDWLEIIAYLDACIHICQCWFFFFLVLMDRSDFIFGNVRCLYTILDSYWYLSTYWFHCNEVKLEAERERENYIKCVH